MATEPLHFANAPIIEAIIAIQIQDLPKSIVPELLRISDIVGSDYPHRTELSQTQFIGEISVEGAKTTTQQSLIGWQFRSNDSKQLFQVRLNGFSFHRLAPYDRWQTFRDEAFKLWRSYQNLVGAMQPVQFSVRYINRLTVPLDSTLEESLCVYPHVPSELPQVLRNYQMRLDFELDEQHSGPGVLNMVQSLLKTPEPDEASILMDNNFAYSALGLPDDALWRRIDDVQDVKDRVFVASLTPEMRRKIS